MPATFLLTAKGSEQLAVRAIKIGIDDYIVKEKFDDDTLFDSINESVYNKSLERSKLLDLIIQGNVFDKSEFIHKLKLITRNNETGIHLLLFNPEAYDLIGKEKGLSAQSLYISHIANRIYRYLTSKKIKSNIFIYRDEYIAVIIEKKFYKRDLNYLYKLLDADCVFIGSNVYSVSVCVGIISSSNIEISDFDKSDFELLSLAQMLCVAAKDKEKMKVCSYGEINLKNIEFQASVQLTTKISRRFNIEQIIADGRISATYQPWIYISSDETINVKDRYDVRIQVIDVNGDKFVQYDFEHMMEDAFTKRVVDRWVLRKTVTQLVELSEKSGKKNNIRMIVKITLSSLSDPKFTPWLHQLIRNADLPKGYLIFELDYHRFMRDPERYKIFIEEFGKQYEITFILAKLTEIDDYYHTRNIQRFDYIKLDMKYLIYGMPRSPLYKLVNTIKDDGAKIVAIKVEDAEMLSLATEFDIDFVEGFFIGKPESDVISDSTGEYYCVV